MSHQHLSHSEWLSRFNDHLKNERYASGTMKYYLPRVREFLAFLKQQRIELSSVSPTDVERHLEDALRRFRRQYGRSPLHRRWRSAYAAPIDKFLQLAHGQWPPDPRPATVAEKFQRELCKRYVHWMVDIRGLAPATVSDRRKEATRFIRWLGKRANRAGIVALSVADIDSYVKHRSLSKRRSSVKL